MDLKTRVKIKEARKKRVKVSHDSCGPYPSRSGVPLGTYMSFTKDFDDNGKIAWWFMIKLITAIGGLIWLLTI